MLNGLCALISVARRREEPGCGTSCGRFSRSACICGCASSGAWCAACTRSRPRGRRRNRRIGGRAGRTTWRIARRDRDTRRARRARPGRHRRATNGATIPRRLRFFDDLKPDEPSIHLPLIQCRECHVTGWGAVKRAAELRLERDLRVFYNRFFLRDVDVVYLFPADAPRGVRGFDVGVCGACGMVLAADAAACNECQSDRLVRVFRPDSVEPRGRGKSGSMRLSRDCPYCGAREGADHLRRARRQPAERCARTGPGFALQRRSQGDRLLGQRAGRRPPRRVLRGANRQRRRPRGHRAGRRTARRHRAGGPPREGGDVVAHGGQPRRVRRPSASSASSSPPTGCGCATSRRCEREGRLPAGSRLPASSSRNGSAGTPWPSSATGRPSVAPWNGRAPPRSAWTDEPWSGLCRDAHLRIREKFGTLRDLEPATVRALALGVLRRMKERGAIRSEVTSAWLAAGQPVLVAERESRAAGLRSAVAPAHLPGRRTPQWRRSRTAGSPGTVRRKSWYQAWAEKS